MKVLAIIPARSGSKGVKNKNIMELCGKPLMAYTIDAAIKSKVFDEIMVSTNSIKYKKIAIKYGAKVPFLRSKENSSDTSSTIDVVKEVLYNYKVRNKSFDAFCILQPTSPLRTEKDIVNAYNIFKTKAKVSVVSVVETDHSPLWCNTLDDNLSLERFINNNILNKRRQDISKYYRINGAIYFVYINEFFKNSNFYRKGSYAYVMNKYCSLDIDTMYDFKYAKFILESF